MLNFFGRMKLVILNFFNLQIEGSERWMEEGHTRDKTEEEPVRRKAEEEIQSARFSAMEGLSSIREIYVNDEGGPDSRMAEYLERTGWLERALSSRKEIFVELPESSGTVIVNIPEWMTGQNAINALRSEGLLNKWGICSFSNWPMVSDVYGSDHHHVYAPVCELTELDHYSLKGILKEDEVSHEFVCLYGCPRARGLKNVQPSKRVSVLEF